MWAAAKLKKKRKIIELNKENEIVCGTRMYVEYIETAQCKTN